MDIIDCLECVYLLYTLERVYRLFILLYESVSANAVYIHTTFSATLYFYYVFFLSVQLMAPGVQCVHRRQLCVCVCVCVCGVCVCVHDCV